MQYSAMARQPYHEPPHIANAGAKGASLTNKHDAGGGDGAPLAADAVDEHANGDHARYQARHLRVVERVQEGLAAAAAALLRGPQRASTLAWV